MKKICLLLCMLVLLSCAPACMGEASLSDNSQLMHDTIRWNLNLPKQSQLLRAEEYLMKLTKDITLHALLMEVSLSPDLEMMYGMGGRIMVIDLDTGAVIDYKNFNGDVRWPDEGDITSKDDALHLLYNSYWAWLEGYNEFIMSMHEFVTPVSEDEIAAINASLTELFVR